MKSTPTLLIQSLSTPPLKLKVHVLFQMTMEPCKKKLFNSSDDDNDDHAVVNLNKPNFKKEKELDATEILKNFKCESCGKDFKKKFNLQRHTKTCSTEKKMNKNWLCNHCDFNFYRAKELKDHLMNIHNEEIQTRHFKFHSYHDFEKWKLQEEEKTYTFFAKRNGTTDYERFCCNRHGSKRKDKGLNLRKRRKGRLKQNLQCLATIIVRKRSNNEVEVEYTDRHCHPLTQGNLAFVPLPKETRSEMEDLLTLGLSPKKVGNSSIT